MDGISPESPLNYWLALLHCPGIGAKRFAELLQHYGDPASVFNYGVKELGVSGLPKESVAWLRNPDWSIIEPDLTWLAASERHHIITLADPAYPPLLLETDNPPPLLFVNGDPSILKAPQLGVVGSRNPSSGGQENARNFAKSLAQAGLAITSGLALGIDAAAHEGALAGGGATIAVTGTGLDRVYPARHRELAHRIAASGALISEFPIGTPPLADHFPRRNRIISGLSLGTLVVEAAPRSGSLITARLAAEQGREVFAIPGSIHNPMARGCHALIRQGAKLIETVEDILEELGPLAALNHSLSHDDCGDDGIALDANQLKILENMGHDPVSVDALVERASLTTEEVSAILLVLELQGVVSSAAGGLYTRITN
jgi:DNA processing protein